MPRSLLCRRCQKEQADKRLARQRQLYKARNAAFTRLRKEHTKRWRELLREELRRIEREAGTVRKRRSGKHLR